MCGIAGIVRFSGLRPDEHDLGAAMAATLRHRGPDEEGSLSDGVASLGHARLSVIDLAGGRQPMGNEDGSIWVAYNGEIYNRPQLAAALRERGHVLRTRCDTELIPHLYEEYGEEFVHQLNGMFAIALWDACRRKLLLIRDRLGVKPLYWHDDGRRVRFGSELKALLAAGDLDPRVDPLALADYLTFGHVPAPRTIFEGVRKLPAGTMAVCTAAGTSVRRYWDIPFPEAGDPGGDDEYWIERFGELLQDAVAVRLAADVPVGAFLSGGVDSATVATAMARTAPGRVLTHTVGFDERDHDERAAARQVANLLGTDHHEVMVRPDAAWAAEHLARHFDEPFADSSAIPTFYLSRTTRQRVTVALAGDGSDELLGGYRRYHFDLAESRWRARIPRWLLAPAAGLLAAVYPKADWLPRPLRAKATLQNLACDDITAHLRSVSLYGGILPELLLRREVLARQLDYSPYERCHKLLAAVPAAAPLLSRLLFLDLKTLLPDDMLTKVDRASMAVALEVREPLLDYRLVELAACAPPHLRLDKQLLRGTLARWASPEIAGRQKRGFNVPVDAWFRGPLREMAGDILTAPAARFREWIDIGAVGRIFRDHQRGLRNNGNLLYALLSLELWARAYCPAAAQKDGKGGRGSNLPVQDIVPQHTAEAACAS